MLQATQGTNSNRCIRRTKKLGAAQEEATTALVLEVVVAPVLAVIATIQSAMNGEAMEKKEQ